jgi:hypothetical protein
MGSGSFGGGSGSFGGGSGSFGGGSGSFGGGGSGGGGGGPSGTDSVHDRILKLTKLTASVNANPEIAKMRATISKMLQDRTRSAFLRVTLADAMVVSAYKALLSLEADLRGGAAVVNAVSKLGGSPAATLADLTDVICQNGQAADTDERTERIVRRAVTDLLLRTVGNGHDLYYDTPVENLGTKFTGTPLQNTADFFLGTLIGEAVRGDLLTVSAEAKTVIGDASHEIAVSWTDTFKDRSRKKGVSFRDMMQTIGADYSAYSGDKDE